MIDSSDSSDAEPEKTLPEQLDELNSDIEDVTPKSVFEAMSQLATGSKMKIPDVYCCCFDGGVEGTYQEVNSHESVCSLRHYNMETVGKWSSFVNLMGIRILKEE